jgi:hypothetical protein
MYLVSLMHMNPIVIKNYDDFDYFLVLFSEHTKGAHCAAALTMETDEGTAVSPMAELMITKERTERQVTFGRQKFTEMRSHGSTWLTATNSTLGGIEG